MILKDHPVTACSPRCRLARDTEVSTAAIRLFSEAMTLLCSTSLQGSCPFLPEAPKCLSPPLSGCLSGSLCQKNLLCLCFPPNRKVSSPIYLSDLRLLKQCAIVLLQQQLFWHLTRLRQSIESNRKHLARVSAFPITPPSPHLILHPPLCFSVSFEVNHYCPCRNTEQNFAH